jgi:hypothetical protein
MERKPRCGVVGWFSWCAHVIHHLLTSPPWCTDVGYSYSGRKSGAEMAHQLMNFAVIVIPASEVPKGAYEWLP